MSGPRDGVTVERWADCPECRVTNVPVTRDGDLYAHARGERRPRGERCPGSGRLAPLAPADVDCPCGARGVGVTGGLVDGHDWGTTEWRFGDQGCPYAGRPPWGRRPPSGG